MSPIGWTPATRRPLRRLLDEAPAFSLVSATPRDTKRPADGPVVVRLADIEPEAVDWLWPRRLARGKLTLVIGEPGGGKTYFVIDCGARVTRGQPWPDGTTPAPGEVIVLTSEDGVADTLRPRFDHQGGDPSRVHILRSVRVDGAELPFTLERDLPQLARVLTERPDTGLVILDPVSAYLGSRDSYKDAEIRGLLSPLAALAERFDVALLAILHLTKAAQRKLLLRAQGLLITQDLPEGFGFVDHPGVHGGDQGRGTDEVHLQGKDAEEEVAVGMHRSFSD